MLNQQGLTKLKFYKKFNNSLLPNHIKKGNLIKNLSFLSPTLIIMHGSRISGVRFSPRGEKDTDLIIVTYKKRFWNLRELYNRLDIVLKDYEDKIDISIISPGELKAILFRNSSLMQSLMRGFTILS